MSRTSLKMSYPTVIKISLRMVSTIIIKKKQSRQFIISNKTNIILNDIRKNFLNNKTNKRRVLFKKSF